MRKSVVILNFLLFLFNHNLIKAQSFCVPLREKGTMGVIDKSGKIIFKIDSLLCEVTNFPDLPDGILVARPKDWEQKRSYFINTSGKIVKFIPNYICGEFTHGYSACFRKTPSGEIYAVFNTKGELVLEGNFDKISIHGDNMIAYRIRNEKKYRLRNLSSREEKILADDIQDVYSYSDTFSEDLIRYTTEKDNKRFLGYFNKSGKIVIPATYDFAQPFSEGLAFVMKDNKAFFIDKTGTRIIENSKIGYAGYYLWGTKFADGLANVSNLSAPKIGAMHSNDGPSGYINKKGEWVIKADKNNFYQASHFKYGLAVTLDYSKSDNSYTTRFINTKGETVLSGIYGDYNAVGIFWNENFIYIYPINTLFDKKGKVVWKPNYPTMFVTKKVEFENANPLNIEYLSYDDEIDYDPKLRTKFLNCNKLERLFFSSQNKLILKKINSFKNLKMFILYGTIDELPIEIMELKNLEEVELSNTGLKTISTDILNLPKLKKVTFISNHKLIVTPEFRKAAKEKKIEILETELPIIGN
jgi:hypothetical protein